MANDKEKASSQPEPDNASDGKPTEAKSQGGVLIARERAREQRKLMLWKSRVNMIRKARGYMNQKMFSDAAVSFEKYIRILENVFDCKRGELTPEHFKDSARTQELTIVASVYWDLLRIYDTSEKYGDRQMQAAKKLAEFLKFTPIYPDIMKKAEAFSRQAKHPEAFKDFLKLSSENRGRCFIATAAFESPEAEEVKVLIQYRDQVLFFKPWGPRFIEIYQRYSPKIASILDRATALKPLVRGLLRLIVRFFVASRS